MGARAPHTLVKVVRFVQARPLKPDTTKRTGWDSNPRYPCGHTGFRDRPFQPLTHLSTNGWRTDNSNRRTDAAVVNSEPSTGEPTCYLSPVLLCASVRLFFLFSVT